MEYQDTIKIEVQQDSFKDMVVYWTDVTHILENALYLKDSKGMVATFVKDDETCETRIPLRVLYNQEPLTIIVHKPRPSPIALPISKGVRIEPDRTLSASTRIRNNLRRALFKPKSVPIDLKSTAAHHYQTTPLISQKSDLQAQKFPKGTRLSKPSTLTAKLPSIRSSWLHSSFKVPIAPFKDDNKNAKPSAATVSRMQPKSGLSTTRSHIADVRDEKRPDKGSTPPPVRQRWRFMSAKLDTQPHGLAPKEENGDVKSLATAEQFMPFSAALTEDNDRFVDSAVSGLGRLSTLPISNITSLASAPRGDEFPSAASALSGQCTLPESAFQPPLTILKDNYKRARFSADPGQFSFDNIRLVERIGHGAQAEVFRAKCGLEDVVVKRFLDSKHKSTMQEIAIIQQLTHKHIVEFYHVHHDMVVMEYVEGGNLTEAIVGKALKTWEVKARIAKDISLGLAYLHSQGIIHCDIKSSNILLTKLKEARICDFGHAIRAGEDGVGGTLQWMAPELLQNPSQYTSKSDVYALGMVMWEMASESTQPYRDHTPDGVMHRIQNGILEECPDHTPKNYANYIHMCWRQLPEDRPTAADIFPDTEPSSQ
ncbi:hypothetical protein BGZ72_011042 [Mortierella alpina]|nr:hypothetical protein BGZ72_011042 [Mortierella alpina]